MRDNDCAHRNTVYEYQPITGEVVGVKCEDCGCHV